MRVYVDGFWYGCPGRYMADQRFLVPLFGTATDFVRPFGSQEKIRLINLSAGNILQ